MGTPHGADVLRGLVSMTHNGLDVFFDLVVRGNVDGLAEALLNSCSCHAGSVDRAQVGKHVLRLVSVLDAPLDLSQP